MGGGNLDTFIQTNAEKRFLLIEPGGNNGDRLIYRGLECRLDEHGVAYESIQYTGPDNVISYPKRVVNDLASNVGRIVFPYPKLDRADVVVIHGGGNMNDLWGFGIELLRKVLLQVPDTPVVVGPQTYWFAETAIGEVLAGDTPPVHLFCRERYSYNILQGATLPPDVSVTLSDDTALYLDPEWLRGRLDEPVSETGYDLYAFRDDRESVLSRHDGAGQGPGGTTADGPDSASSGGPDGAGGGTTGGDGSADGDVVRADVSDEQTHTFEEFIATVDGARTIYTDRLHVALLGHLLDTAVTLYENSYYKNRGVYKYSLADDPDVTFRDAV